MPARLQVRLIQEDGRPFADLPYQLLVNGDEFEGRTDGDGFVRQWVPPEAAAATLLLETENTIYEYALRLHRLVPASSDEGLMQRLDNLGHPRQESVITNVLVPQYYASSATKRSRPLVIWMKRPEDI